MTAPTAHGGGAAIDRLVGRDEWDAVTASGRPFVVYKYAATLDGRIAAVDGTSRWVSGRDSRAEVHRLRATCDATVVGSGTLVADDPHLAVRDVDAARDRQPYRVVVDTDARTPPDARILDGAAPTLVAVAADTDAAHLAGPAEVVRLPRSKQGLDVAALLEALHARGVRAVLLEGGPTLAGSFVRARLVDRFVIYLAPALLGAGRAGLGDTGVATIADLIRLDVIDVGRSGVDVRVLARPARP